MKYKTASRIGATAKHPMTGITENENGQPTNSTGYKEQVQKYALNRDIANRLGRFISPPIVSL